MVRRRVRLQVVMPAIWAISVYDLRRFTAEEVAKVISFSRYGVRSVAWRPRRQLRIGVSGRWAIRYRVESATPVAVAI